jgi:uncharacterized protein YdeI (YjbR/CyaY-like superfamily)
MEFYASTREEWREWLERNHSESEGVWLIYFKKSSGKPRIPYNDAVEEALCFGWIDGKIRKINEEYYVQLFTPRRRGSRWSKYNIDRVKKMIKESKMEPAGLSAFKEALEKPDLIYENRSGGVPLLPEELADALSRNITAYENFKNFPLSAQRMYILWFNNAKREGTRASRINKIVEFAEKNVRPGML